MVRVFRPVKAPMGPQTRRALALLVERGPMTEREIAAAMGVTPSQVNDCCHALKRRGLAMKGGHGKPWRVVVGALDESGQGSGPVTAPAD